MKSGYNIQLLKETQLQKNYVEYNTGQTMKKYPFILTLSLAFLTPVAVSLLLLSGAEAGSIMKRPQGPCDVYKAGGTPCVAAHSTTRALSASYNGPLYQLLRQSDGKTLDIGIIQPTPNDPGGYADAAAQDAFCANTMCWITVIFDQSGKGNDLLQAPPGTFKGPAKGAFNNLPIADMAPVTIAGHKAYGVYIMPGMGLRNNNAKDLPINDEAEGIYYVVNGKHYDSGCCFDYGNSSTNSRAVGTGTMETTYYGISTAWGSGNGSGPWIMADMEAGLFSGYNAKKNDVPSIDTWNFVTAIVNGGGGNRWELKGGDAQKGNLTTYYEGVRPGTPQNSDYSPMNKKGGILLGNGGDNGNGSAGTFYEGVMTTGFPTAATSEAVQANIVAARYDVQRLGLSRITTFTPGSVQEVTVSFTNTTGAPFNNLSLNLVVPKGWAATVSGTNRTTYSVAGAVAPGTSVSAGFTLTSSAAPFSGYVSATARWKRGTTSDYVSEKTAQRVRNSYPVTINEVRLGTSDNASNQFVELYNASSFSVDISGWKVVHARSEWAPFTLATIPAGTKLAPKGFFLLGLSASGLVAPALNGQKTLLVRETTGFEPGQAIDVDGENGRIAQVGTAASPQTTLFIPVSTGPWLNFPTGTSKLPVTDATGFVVGQHMGIDWGGRYEVVTVTSLGKAATQTNLAAAAKAGETTIKVATNVNMTVGDKLTISTGSRTEIISIKRILNVAVAPVRGASRQAGASVEPGEVELETPLKYTHMNGVDVSDPGTGIGFTPATRFAHRSGDAVQALGSGIVLDRALAWSHAEGSPVVNKQQTKMGYQDAAMPQLWFGSPLSAAAGSIALLDKTGKIMADGLVYGSQQSNSSANGTIPSPEIATLEGVQHQGGQIVVVPASGRRGFGPAAQTAEPSNKSVGRFPDGADSDNNVSDFKTQRASSQQATSVVSAADAKVPIAAQLPTPGKPNQY